jgi:hypothetical protein
MVVDQQKTIQTHTNQNINTVTGNTQAAYMDCRGYEKIAINLKKDITGNAKVDIIWSHDGVNPCGDSRDVIPSNSALRDSGIVETRAEYAKVYIYNSHTATIQFNCWAYLKS